MFKNLLITENNLKSIFSYQLSKKYGYKENEYLKPNNFNKDKEMVRQVNDVLKKVSRQVRFNGTKHTATMHYMNNYGYIPLWIMVKVLSFGLVADFYQILKREDQQEIASYYGLKVETLEIYLPILANYRNLCAHEDILYEHQTEKNIPNDYIHQRLEIMQDDLGYIYGKNDLFSVVIMLKKILHKEDFTRFMNEVKVAINELDNNITCIRIEKILNRMGFPKNWTDIENM